MKSIKYDNMSLIVSQKTKQIPNLSLLNEPNTQNI